MSATTASRDAPDGSPLEPGGVAGRVSVIIPAYNYAHFIGQCIASVTAQNGADIEIVVVDDGSQDDTASVVRAFDQVTYIHQHNQGLSAARNTGIRASSGEFLLFLDADDLLAPHSLAPRRDFLRHNPDIALSVCRNRLFSAVSPGGRARLRGWWRLPPSALDLRLLHFNIAPPHAWLLRRRVVAATGWFDVGLRACEDYDYWLRALALGYVPVYCPAGEVLYRKHEASMSANQANQLHHDALLHARVFELLLQRRRLRVSNALTAVLAAYAGLFATLARLPSALAGDRAQLQQVVDASVPRLGDFAAAHAHACELLTSIYLLQFQAHAHADAARAAHVLQAVADAFGVPLQRDAWSARTAALSLVCDRDAPFIDRYRLGRLIGRHLLASRSPAP